MTLRQRYIAFGVVFAILVIGALFGLAFALNNLGSGGGEAGVGVAPPPEVVVAGKRINVVGESIELPDGSSGLRTPSATYTLVAEPALQDELSRTRGASIRVIGNVLPKQPNAIVVNRFFDVSDPGAGPTPAKPRRLPPEQPTGADGQSPARPGQPGTPGGAAVDGRGRPAGYTLPDVGQSVTLNGVIRRSSGTEMVLIDTRGVGHRIWGSPSMIQRIQGLDGHRVTITGIAILGRGSNRNYTINATRVIDRGPVSQRPPADPPSTPPRAPVSANPEAEAPSSVAPMPAPSGSPLFVSGFEDGTAGWVQGCGEAQSARAVRDAGACGGDGAARIVTTTTPSRSGQRALRIETRAGDGVRTLSGDGYDENSLPWSADATGLPGTVGIWRFSFRLAPGMRSGVIATWRSVGCPNSPNPVQLEIEDSSLVVATAGGFCSALSTDRRFVLDRGGPWTVQADVWYDLSIAIRFDPAGGQVWIANGQSTWGRMQGPVGYQASDGGVVFALAMGLRQGDGGVTFDDVAYYRG